jgi:hypothetical protein
VVGAVFWELDPPDEVEEAGVEVELGCDEVVEVVENGDVDVLVTGPADVAVMLFDTIHQEQNMVGVGSAGQLTLPTGTVPFRQ